MADQFDMLFEQAMCDHWWVQDNAQVVKNAGFEYLKSRKDHRLYNAVVRVSPQFDQYKQLLDEVMLAHRGKGSEWRIGAPSYTAGLEQAVMAAGYKVDGSADAWTIQVDAPRPAQPHDIAIKRVETVQDMRDMVDVMNLSFSASRPKSDAELHKQLQMCTGENARCLRFVAYDKTPNAHFPLVGSTFTPIWLWVLCGEVVRFPKRVAKVSILRLLPNAWSMPKNAASRESVCMPCVTPRGLSLKPKALRSTVLSIFGVERRRPEAAIHWVCCSTMGPSFAA